MYVGVKYVHEYIYIHRECMRYMHVLKYCIECSCACVQYVWVSYVWKYLHVCVSRCVCIICVDMCIKISPYVDKSIVHMHWLPGYFFGKRYHFM